MWKSMQNDETKKTRLALKPLVVALLVVSVGVVIFFAIKLQNDTRTIRVKDATLAVELAQTLDEKSKGLCCRDSLAENSGMLFIYDRPSKRKFWMKDTRIPLDMFWLSSEKKIIHIEENVQPQSFPKRFGPAAPAQYVLETNAGFAKSHSIKVGDKVSF